MTPKDFHERVWNGLREYARKHYGSMEDAKVVVHPATRAMLAMETDAFEWEREPSGAERYRGVPLELDPRISEDAILIRSEVEA